MWEAIAPELSGHRICATEDCCVPARWRFEAGDVVSFYCSSCRSKIEKHKALADHDLAYTNPRAYNQFI